jgi:hypothetical protein
VVLAGVWKVQLLPLFRIEPLQTAALVVVRVVFLEAHVSAPLVSWVTT